MSTVFPPSTQLAWADSNLHKSNKRESGDSYLSTDSTTSTATTTSTGTALSGAHSISTAATSTDGALSVPKFDNFISNNNAFKNEIVNVPLGTYSARPISAEPEQLEPLSQTFSINSNERLLSEPFVIPGLDLSNSNNLASTEVKASSLKRLQRRLTKRKKPSTTSTLKSSSSISGKSISTSSPPTLPELNRANRATFIDTELRQLLDPHTLRKPEAPPLYTPETSLQQDTKRPLPLPLNSSYERFIAYPDIDPVDSEQIPPYSAAAPSDFHIANPDEAEQQRPLSEKRPRLTQPAIEPAPAYNLLELEALVQRFSPLKNAMITEWQMQDQNHIFKTGNKHYIIIPPDSSPPLGKNYHFIMESDKFKLLEIKAFSKQPLLIQLKEEGHFLAFRENCKSRQSTHNTMRSKISSRSKSIRYSLERALTQKSLFASKTPKEHYVKPWKSPDDLVASAKRPLSDDALDITPFPSSFPSISEEKLPMATEKAEHPDTTVSIKPDKSRTASTTSITDTLSAQSATFTATTKTLSTSTPATTEPTTPLKSTPNKIRSIIMAKLSLIKKRGHSKGATNTSEPREEKPKAVLETAPPPVVSTTPGKTGRRMPSLSFKRLSLRG